MRPPNPADSESVISFFQLIQKPKLLRIDPANKVWVPRNTIRASHRSMRPLFGPSQSRIASKAKLPHHPPGLSFTFGPK